MITSYSAAAVVSREVAGSTNLTGTVGGRLPAGRKPIAGQLGLSAMP